RTTFENDPYDGEIASMDHGIGQILDLLRTQNLLESTLIVAVGDHGEGLGDHGEETHGYFLYDSTVHVPLIIAGPGVPKGKAYKDVVTMPDIAPTLLEALRHPGALKSADGKSFWHEMQTGNFTPRIALLENRGIHYQFGWSAISGI